jgi:hypothetical protein
VTVLEAVTTGTVLVEGAAGYDTAWTFDTVGPGYEPDRSLLALPVGPPVTVQVDPSVQVWPFTVVAALASAAFGTASYVTVLEAVTTGTVLVEGVAG